MKISDLHPQEEQLLRILHKKGEKIAPENISDMELIAVERTAYWLSEKDLATIEEQITTFIRLTSEGKTIANEGFVEEKILSVLDSKKTMSQIITEANISNKDFNIGLGWMKRRQWVTINKEEGQLALELTQKGEEAKNIELPEKRLLKKLLSQELTKKECDENIISVLRKRNLVLEEEHKSRLISISDKGKNLVESSGASIERINLLTPEIIKDGTWKNKTFRAYDVHSPVPKMLPAKGHPLRLIIDKIRHIFLEMGFSEMRGPMVEMSFWNFDALFQPQDHPAREMADTFYMEAPSMAKLPEKLVQPVKSAHENGTTGSSGWGYKWSEEVAKKLLLRTHTTAVSARMLSQIKPPAKIFSVDRAFRNEAIDYKHLMEFHQVEGIVVDPSVTFKDLLGLLKEFYYKLGFEKVRFRPAYFPYTEMSVEPEIWFEPKQSWFELGGSGMFRPEVTKPLGIECPVLAWGLGLERLAMLVLQDNDIRDLYKNNLKWIQNKGGIY